MPLLKSCLLCFSPKTGAFILGTVGIIISCTLLAPLVVFLEYHTFYITQFAQSKRDRGTYLEDENVPEMELFSKALYSAVLALDVIYVFSCILLLTGLTTTKHLLLVPWLVYMGSAILIMVTIIISFIIGLADYNALAVFMGSSPVLCLVIYFWLVVLSAYQMLRGESCSLREGPAPSASHSSLVSIKDGISRVLGGTPPPPYEAVTTELGTPKPKSRQVLDRQMSADSMDSITPFIPASEAEKGGGPGCLTEDAASTNRQQSPSHLADPVSEAQSRPDAQRISQLYHNLVNQTGSRKTTTTDVGASGGDYSQSTRVQQPIEAATVVVAGTEGDCDEVSTAAAAAAVAPLHAHHDHQHHLHHQHAFSTPPSPYTRNNSVPTPDSRNRVASPGPAGIRQASNRRSYHQHHASATVQGLDYGPAGRIRFSVSQSDLCSAGQLAVSSGDVGYNNNRRRPNHTTLAAGLPAQTTVAAVCSRDSAGCVVSSTLMRKSASSYQAGCPAAAVAVPPTQLSVAAAVAPTEQDSKFPTPSLGECPQLQRKFSLPEGGRVGDAGAQQVVGEDATSMLSSLSDDTSSMSTTSLGESASNSNQNILV